MSEYQVTGPEVKKLINLSAKQDINFAFSPGKSPEESYLAMHKKKAVEALWKAAKKEGPSNKAASGTMRLDGKLLSITCTTEAPGFAKKLKKFLKANRCSVNVQVMDGGGNVLDADIDELPEDEDPAEAGGGEALAGEAATEESGGEDDGKKEALSDEFKEIFPAIRAKIANSEPAAGDKLKAAVQAFSKELEASSYDRAEQLLEVLKREAAHVEDTTPAAEDTVEDLAKEADTTGSDSEDGGVEDAARKKELSEAFKQIFPAIRTKIASSEPAIGDKLKAAAQAFGTEIKAARFDRAQQILDVLKRQATEAAASTASTAGTVEDLEKEAGSTERVDAAAENARVKAKENRRSALSSLRRRAEDLLSELA